MKIVKKEDSVFVSKPEGTNVNYYLRGEYEVHFNEQAPGTTQTWHHHEKVSEILYIVEGELLAEWRESGEEKAQIVKAGDLIETEKAPHTFSNNSNSATKFIVIKIIRTGNDNSEILKNDKVLD